MSYDVGDSDEKTDQSNATEFAHIPAASNNTISEVLAGVYRIVNTQALRTSPLGLAFETPDIMTL